MKWRPMGSVSRPNETEQWNSEMGKATLQNNGQVEVWLSLEAQHQASRIAYLRHHSHREKGRGDFKSRPQDDGRILDLSGALAEQAFAVAAKLPWDGSFKPMSEWNIWRRDGHDVSGIEVKSIRVRDRCLILHEHSKPELPAVLVLVQSRHLYTLIGWCFTHEGQKAEYWNADTYRSCFMVPQSDLRPMVELFALLGVSAPEREHEVTSEELDAHFLAP